ncbi:30S ribosomal protein S16 [Fulvivirgaceae bacterium BMA10]|uniref:Small ribosomal subunit protein bS16 n=1 Tax=Splendidivirga corallicola TaxID=3051826 RepID=A0ABT8KMZ7_9BACT|nr:30S ribosomal protein S16 [Fulvivirgaceae bacterium BMA10]
MAVKIRLARRGRKKLAMYDIVVADARAPRDGRFIEKLGTYNPNTDPASIDLNADRAFKWVMDGAQPTDTARAILSYRGVMLKKHLQIGVNKGAITQEQADTKFEQWLKEKEAKIAGKIDTLNKQQEADAKKRLEAETKIKEARTEALKKKQAELAPEPQAEEVEAVATEEAVAEEPATAEAETQEEVKAEEAPAKEEPKADEPEAKEEPKAEAAPVEETPTEEKAEEVEEVKAEAQEEKKEEKAEAPEAKESAEEEETKE